MVVSKNGQWSFMTHHLIASRKALLVRMIDD